MKQTLRLGRVAGIPVGVHWSVLVIMVLLVQALAVTILPNGAPGWPWPVYAATGVSAALLFLLSLLAHELAHALVARYFRIRVERVTLWLLGGVAELAEDAPSARADLFIAAAGPLTSVGVAVAFGGGTLASVALGGPSVVTAALAWLAVINLILAVFNLLPGAPLDGGRVLRALLWWWRGDRDRASRTAARTGYFLGLALIMAGVAQLVLGGSLGGLWLAIVGWFLISAASAEEAGARYRTLLGQSPVRAVMNPYPVCGYPDQTVEDFLHNAAASTGHHAFPIRDWYGRPAGVIRIADLAAVPAGARASTPLSKLTRQVPQVRVVDATLPAVGLKPPPSNGELILVVDEGLLVGVLTASDLIRAARSRS